MSVREEEGPFVIAAGVRRQCVGAPFFQESHWISVPPSIFFSTRLKCLRTVPILCRSIVKDRVHVIRGKKFPAAKYPGLTDILRSPNTILLYPGPDAVDLSEVSLLDCGSASEGGNYQSYNVIILDGTWAQARGLYHQNEMLHWPRKAQIQYGEKSKYVIRTQPTDSALSTLETAAVAISILEDRPDIVEILTRPLEALCDFQLLHGAVKHQSREYKIENGLWTKPLPRSTLRRLQKLRTDGERNTL
ncbi:hypothetical protein C0Q70_19937 [Pomacea canaliculata]|uniref:tRNA-uridine aminocarboxypropyltransferase n=1 Tax=Pomacea canaliculata TaxID=400727 RepID=A0A2T7NE46_POMCA|nr:hypothetical protein C0Q70_19937 [Pomacea canaliculata]